MGCYGLAPNQHSHPMDDLPDKEWVQMTIGGSCLPMSGAFMNIVFAEDGESKVDVDFDGDLSDDDLVVMSAVLSELINQIALMMLRRRTGALQ